MASARAVDVAVVLFIGGVTEVLAWTDGFLGTHLEGPRWLTASLPLLLAVPLLWRRRFPLLAWSLVAAAICLQALASGNSAEGLEIVAALIAGPYAVAAYGTRRNAAVGLGLLAVTYTIYVLNDQNFHSGRVAEKWASAFFGLAALAAWLVGTTVRARREHASAAERARLLDEQARIAVAEERGRVARELHDIVSHNLSVVVLQAAGGRAASEHAGFDVSDTLERIEESGREALIEMRRMLGVLRTEGAEADLAPQPGLHDVPLLVESLRRSGLSIDARCPPDVEVPPAIGLSAYRIVQEALTNVLKHAGRCHVDVTIRRDGSDLAVSIRDDGNASSAPQGTVPAGGHGLSGMRERVALLGGELNAGPCTGGGFEVCARLPLQRAAT